MIGCRLLAQVHQALVEAKHPTDTATPFGGVNVIFFGDFYQLPPVGNLPLYTPSSRFLSRMSETNTKQSLGRALWTKLNEVIFLSQQMRQDTSAFNQMLQRIRNGNSTAEDYELLLQRVVGSSGGPTLSEGVFRSATVVTILNSVRCQLNQLAVKRLTDQLKLPIVYSVAVDQLSQGQTPSPALQQTLWQLSDDKTGGQMGLFPCLPGMPVMLKENLATELGLCNSSIGELVSVVVNPLDYQRMQQIESDQVTFDAMN